MRTYNRITGIRFSTFEMTMSVGTGSATTIRVDNGEIGDYKKNEGDLYTVCTKRMPRSAVNVQSVQNPEGNTTGI